MSPNDATNDAWLYLNAVCERPTSAMWDFVDIFGPVEAAERIAARELGGFPAVARQTDARAKTTVPDELRDLAQRHGARFLCPADPHWPALALAALDRPRAHNSEQGPGDLSQDFPLAPFGMWIRGGGQLVDLGAVRTASVVGTRELTSYGRVVANEIGEACAGEDIAVISGGALGVDIAAHLGALAGDGVTAAVLACGVDKLYPSANSRTLARIAESGGVISEYPPGASVTRYRFLDRNRLIAALGQVTVVVEAAMRSGALSTARWANGLDRPVFAVPGSIHSRPSAGCNTLLGMYALPITRSGEIGELVPTLGRGRTEAPTPYDVGGRRPTSRPGNPASFMTERQRRVFETLRGDSPQTAVEISQASAVPIAEAREELDRLVLSGFVTKRGGGWQLRTRKNREATPQLF